MSGLAGSILRFLEILAVSIWFGAIPALCALVAPTLFAKLPTRAQAGELFGHILSKFYVSEIALGLFLIVLGMLRWKYFEAPMSFSLVKLILVALMIGSTAFVQLSVRPQLRDLRIKIGDFEKTPADNPDRVLFGKFHQQSVMLMGFNWLGAFILLILLVWKP